MPYIKQEQREKFDGKIFVLADALDEGNVNNIASAGDLNYTITELLVRALKLKTSPRYDQINTALGVLEAVKLELYRRLASIYENDKIKINGDIPVYNHLPVE